MNKLMDFRIERNEFTIDSMETIYRNENWMRNIFGL